MKVTNYISAFALLESASRVAALPAFGGNVDHSTPVALNAFKRSSNNVGREADVGGHNIPFEHLAVLVKDSLANGIPKERPLKPRAVFDAAAQLIDVSGDHEFQMPDYDAGDVRGPCPGLNALSNHGYLPRNGIASIAEYVAGVNKVWGMGIDIATILATYGTIFGGNIVSLNPGVSIGGESSSSNPLNLLDNLGGLLGTPRGLSGTHNTFEVDGSPTRNDLYDPIGNNNDLNMTYFTSMYNKQKDAEVPNYTLDVMIENAVERWYQDVSWNPNFVYLPWSGWFVRNSAVVFSGRLFANHSEEYPDGILGKEGLKSIYGVSGPEDNMVYTSGSDRIPENYYRRPVDYSLVEGTMDMLLEVAAKHPVLFSIGGNVDGVNTFAGIDFADITGGAFNATGLLEGNNLLCFAFQALKEGSPNVLSSLYTTLAPVLSALTELADTLFLSLECPAYKDLSVNGTDLFTYIQATYPGASLSGGGL